MPTYGLGPSFVRNLIEVFLNQGSHVALPLTWINDHTVAANDGASITSFKIVGDKLKAYHSDSDTFIKDTIGSLQKLLRPFQREFVNRFLAGNGEAITAADWESPNNDVLRITADDVKVSVFTLADNQLRHRWEPVGLQIREESDTVLVANLDAAMAQGPFAIGPEFIGATLMAQGVFAVRPPLH